MLHHTYILKKIKTLIEDNRSSFIQILHHVFKNLGFNEYGSIVL